MRQAGRASGLAAARTSAQPLAGGCAGAATADSAAAGWTAGAPGGRRSSGFIAGNRSTCAASIEVDALRRVPSCTQHAERLVPGLARLVDSGSVYDNGVHTFMNMQREAVASTLTLTEQ